MSARRKSHAASTSLLDDARIQHAVEHVKALLLERFPAATFSVYEGEDPTGVYLDATVDSDDLTTIVDAVAEQLLTYQIDEGLPVYVVPRHTPEWNARQLREWQRQNPPRLYHPPREDEDHAYVL